MNCVPERVTGYVDGALSEADRVEVEAHIANCPACAAQAAAERELRQRLRSLPALELPRGLDDRVRRRLRGAGSSRISLRWVLPLAAGLAGLVLWGRGSAPVVARELALDHLKCFRKGTVPAKVFSSDAAQVRAWFDARGTRTPLFPDAAGGLEIVGARHCPLLDGSSVAHVYYTGEGPRRVSLYVVDRELRRGGTYRTTAFGETVHLLRAAGLTVGLVGEREEDVEAFRRRFATTVAVARVVVPLPASMNRLEPSRRPFDRSRWALLR